MFYLIQRGKFNGDGEQLTGKDGVIDLDYMGSSEFEFGSIPRSYRRILFNFEDFNYYNTNIKTLEGDELILFCNKDYASNTIVSLNEFILTPYQLKEYSELEKIPNSSIKDKGYKKLRTNFWWCIDYNRDWMAFLNSKGKLFEKGINNDYNNWWLGKTEDVRKQEYTRSLRK